MFRPAQPQTKTSHKELWKHRINTCTSFLTRPNLVLANLFNSNRLSSTKAHVHPTKMFKEQNLAWKDSQFPFMAEEFTLQLPFQRGHPHLKVPTTAWPGLSTRKPSYPYSPLPLILPLASSLKKTWLRTHQCIQAISLKGYHRTYGIVENVGKFHKTCMGQSTIWMLRLNSVNRPTLKQRGGHLEARFSQSKPFPRHTRRMRKGRNVHEWPSVPCQAIVVPRPVHKSFHFLHVRLPVNLCV